MLYSLSSNDIGLGLHFALTMVLLAIQQPQFSVSSTLD